MIYLQIATVSLNDGAPYDLALMGIGAYDPWIWAHSTPEQAVAMADTTRAHLIIPSASSNILPERGTVLRANRALHPLTFQDAGTNRAA